jgi:hypothetical protein
MNADRVERAKREAIRTRARLESTLCALQARLRPASLAGEAWTGVKDKGGALADNAVAAVKKRPALASAAVGALALFLARAPLRRAVERMLGDEEETDLVTTRIDSGTKRFEPSAPLVDPAMKEGVS